MKNKLINDFIITILFFGTLTTITYIVNPKLLNAASENIEDKLFKRIETAAGINNLEKVKDDIKRVLKLNPKHVGATFYAGKYCYQKGDFENAEKFLKRIIYDPVYGSKANGVLADIRLKKYNSRFLNNLKIYLNGESFDQALQLCEDALADMPDNKELLFSASYASCMLGKKAKAVTYADLYALQTNNSPLSAELKTLVDAWFTESFDNELAIEKFFSLKSKNLLTSPVKRRIKKLLVDSKNFNRYEDFIRKEISLPGADKDALERELITFLLEQHQFNKALKLLSDRPIDSLEDNLLYVWALCETNQDLKALDTAKGLMTVAPRDLRVYRAWVEAWLSYTEKNKKVPEGKDSSGTSYVNTVEKIFNLLRPGKLVKQDPVLLIDLLRMASFNEMDDEIDKIQIEVAKIDFYDEHEKILLKMSDELVDFGRGRIVANILESAVNQLPNNYNLSLKLAQVYLEMNPAASVRICEEVMEQNPDLIRAFTLWCDAMNLAGRGGEAISELVKKLSDESLNEVVKRRLNKKLETLRMQGIQETPYVATPKREEGMSFNEDPENNDLEKNNDNIEDNLEKDNPENTDINSFIPSVVDGNNDDIDF